MKDAITYRVRPFLTYRCVPEMLIAQNARQEESILLKLSLHLFSL